MKLNIILIVVTLILCVPSIHYSLTPRKKQRSSVAQKTAAITAALAFLLAIVVVFRATTIPG